MIRVSATLLESYRRVLKSDYGNEQELVDQISGKPFHPSWQMEVGTAWQALLSSDEVTVERYGFQEGPRKEHFHFSYAAVKAARKHLGYGVCEVKAVRLLEIRGSPVQLVAQVDHINGSLIQENKAKFSTPYASDYEHSLQWRVYLLCHNAACVRYNLFAFKDPDDSGYCELRDIVSFRFWAYPGLEADVRRWLVQFLDWAHCRKLTRFLDRAGSTVSIAEAT